MAIHPRMLIVLVIPSFVACDNGTATQEESAARAVNALSLNNLVDDTRLELKARLSRTFDVTDQGTSELLSLLDTTVTWKASEQPLVDLYTSHFTVKELNFMVEFFESPTGKKYLRKKNTLDSGTRQIVLDGLRDHESQFLDVFYRIRQYRSETE